MKIKSDNYMLFLLYFKQILNQTIWQICQKFKNKIDYRKDYNKLKKTTVILFSDYELKSLENIEKYITKWQIREEEYSKIILTDVMEIYIIELPKVEKYYKNQDNKKLNSWVKFINNPEVVKMSEKDKEIKKAKQVLDEISQDEHERYLAELREKYIMDQKAIEDAGYDKGYDKGKREIAKKLKEQNIDIRTISIATNLSIEEIEKM